MGPAFYLCTETTKKIDKLHEITVCKTLYISKQRTEMWEMRNKGGEPYNFPRLLLWEFCRPCFRKRRWEQSLVISQIKETNLRFWEIKAAWVLTKGYWRGENYTQRALGICSWSPGSTQMRSDQCVRVKESPEMISGHSACSSQAPRFIECWLKSGKESCQSHGGN